MRALLLSLLGTIVLLPSYLLVLLIRVLKWLVAPLALALQILTGVPLALLRVRQPMQPHFIPIVEAELPDAAWVALTDTAEALAASGFSHVGDFRCAELVQDATLWLRLLIQPPEGISALGVYIEFSAGNLPNAQFVEFSTEFDNGRVLVMHNFNQPSSLPAPSYLARLQLKDVWDPRALYVLHRQLVASLAHPIRRDKANDPPPDTAGLLTARYAREIRALIDQGWLTPVAGENQVCLSLRGALMAVWRQAWPLASLYLRGADRRSRRLLGAHGIDTRPLSGSALSIVVERQALPATADTLTSVWAAYDYVRPLALHTDPDAVLEAVVVELTTDAAGTVIPGEFRYSFRSCRHQPERRIRRLRAFDLLLDPLNRNLAVTASDREFDQAPDAAGWKEMIADSPLRPLRPGSWLLDLDTVLPTALNTLNTQSGAARIEPDSASLYSDEEGIPRWQVVAWSEQDTPLHTRMDARNRPGKYPSSQETHHA